MRVENLEQAIQTVMAGQMWVPPEFLARIIASAGNEQPAKNSESVLDKLSKREQEVARYVAGGMSNQEVADTMFVTVRTVKAHLSAIYEKTGLRNRLELGLKVKESGDSVSA